jgi:ferrochelatase
VRDERSRLQAAAIVPIGFVCDHIEVLYDLDHEAAALCRELDLPFVRAETVNDHPKFEQMMADVVRKTWNRYRRNLPLPIVSDAAPTMTEGPPPSRSARMAASEDVG